MRKEQMLKEYMLLCIIGVLVFSGCAATPTRQKAEGVIFGKPVDVVQKAAVDALVVTGFDVQKSDPLYVEGFRPRKIGLFVGSGGETVGIWLESLESSKTQVHVKTAKSLVGIVGQKNWDAEILAEMAKILGK